MHYIAIADTDTGIAKQTNQDGVLIKYGKCVKGEVLLAVVCDGMGGLEKGEVASAAVIREFARWFEEELPYELEQLDLRVIADKWSLLLKDLNRKIALYGKKQGAKLGTTFTGVLFAEGRYVAVHVGDTRFYRLDKALKQLTADQTFVAREVRKGNLTPAQAETDKRRNMLLQCIGASEKIEPEILTGLVKKGAYLLCSDGFRHKISEEEIYEALSPKRLSGRESMRYNVRNLIERVKNRKEKDNISVILVNVV